jgi:hypothetical protein
MKKDDKFTKDQVRDFERRVGRTHSLRFLVEMVQEFEKQKEQHRRKYLEERKERRRLEGVCSGHCQRNAILD